jgi:hypothetical protein
MVMFKKMKKKHLIKELGGTRMNNIIALYCFNAEKIAGALDSFRVSVDYEGNLILLTEKKEKGKYIHEVFHLINGETTKITIPLVSNSFEFAQPLDENWLFVSARTDDEEDYIENATLYDLKGNVLNTFSFGDAIQDVQTTKNSEIWVSYFDENMGSGLSCFNNEGVQTFSFLNFALQKKDVPFIDDCYALNVSEDHINLYYYTDFPLIKLKKDGYEVYHDIPIKGSHAFSIMNDFVLFSHDYDDKPEVYLYSLLDRKKQRFHTKSQEGKSLTYDYAVGRGNKLFLIKGKDIYQISLEDILK